jgi:cell division protein FtsN
MVVKPNAVQLSKLRSQQPGAYRTSYDGKSVMQVGIFSSRTKAESIKKELTGQGFKVLMISDERRISSQPTPTSAGPLLASVTSGASSWGRLVAVPTKAPIGDAKGSKEVYARNTQLPPPPPSPKVLLTRRYRVIVIAKSDAKQDKIRDLVASAFRTTYQGKSAMQVGSFNSSSEAEAKAELMRQNGFKPITEVI